MPQIGCTYRVGLIFDQKKKVFVIHNQEKAVNYSQKVTPVSNKSRQLNNSSESIKGQKNIGNVFTNKNDERFYIPKEGQWICLTKFSFDRYFDMICEEIKLPKMALLKVGKCVFSAQVEQVNMIK